MKSKEEISRKLKTHKEIRQFINPKIEDGKDFAFQEGFISALEWVIEECE